MTPDEIIARAQFLEKARKTALAALPALGPRSAATLFISELQKHPDLGADERLWALTFLDVATRILPGGSAAVADWIAGFGWPGLER